MGFKLHIVMGKTTKFVAWERGGQNAEQSNPDITLTVRGCVNKVATGANQQYLV